MLMSRGCRYFDNHPNNQTTNQQIALHYLDATADTRCRCRSRRAVGCRRTRLSQCYAAVSRSKPPPRRSAVAARRVTSANVNSGQPVSSKATGKCHAKQAVMMPAPYRAGNIDASLA
jgi:hypothetical protein